VPFGTDPIYSSCGGTVKVIACIEDPALIKTILTHLKEKTTLSESIRLPESRATAPVSVQRKGGHASLAD
jgi:hypothetical protein